MARINKRTAQRLIQTLYVLVVLLVGVIELQSTSITQAEQNTSLPDAGSSQVAEALQTLPVKGRAPKTGYSRTMFSSGWAILPGCDVRNFILARDMKNVTFLPNSCKVATAELEDPYTGKTIIFIRGKDTSDAVQIDHVVALSDAWQKGAQQLSPIERYSLANDPLNLLAVDGASNQQKADSDAAGWLPPNKSYRCSYVARQVAVKKKYALWVTTAEYKAIATILITCPEQTLPLI